jgi:hypothetical protein
MVGRSPTDEMRQDRADRAVSIGMIGPLSTNRIAPGGIAAVERRL